MHCHLRVSFLALFRGVALLLGLLAPSLMHAQPSPSARALKVSGPRGSLGRRKGAGSSEDVADWNVAFAAPGGPAVAPQLPAPVNLWSSLGYGLGDPIGSTSVTSIAASGGGDVYAGGYFTVACFNPMCTNDSYVNHIAKWNPDGWSGLANGVDFASFALAVLGTDLYVGGGFKELCGNDACDSGNTTANYIAKWDGHAWSTLRDGVDSDVIALAISGSDLYVGGNFNVICGSSACNTIILNTPVFGIARWDGSLWWDLRYGVDSFVNALAVEGNALYVGGAFTHICATGGCSPGATVNYIASYSLRTVLPTPTGTLADTATLTPTFTAPPPPSLTATHTATALATDTVPAQSKTPTGGAVLVGDCSGRGSVSISDLITLVNIALGSQSASACPDGIPAGTPVHIALLIQAVNNALHS